MKIARVAVLMVAVVLAGVVAGCGAASASSVTESSHLAAQTIPVPLAFSEGVLLRQHAVPVRLPTQVKFLSPQSLPVVLARDSAPAITRRLLHLAHYNPKNLETTSKLPEDIAQPGYFVMMGDAMPMAYQWPLVSRNQFGTTGFAIIGVPSRWAHLPTSHVRIRLATGVLASWYAGAKTDGWPTDALVVWKQDGDTYAILADNPTGVALSQIKPDMIAMARSMATHSPVSSVGRAIVGDRYFDNLHPTGKTAGMLVTQSLRVAPPGTPGYHTQDGVGWRVTRRESPIPRTPPPPYTRSAMDPFPGLGSVLAALHRSSTIPVFLPTVTPYTNDHRGGWPWLSDTIDRGGYAVQMQLTTGKIPPNTVEMLDNFGLSGVLGVVAAGNQVRQANMGGVTKGRLTAPGVTVAQFQQPGWFEHHLVNGVYRGHVTLPDGRTALVVSDAAGDGNHTFVEFYMDGVPYGIGAYHSAMLAVQMAASMTRMH